MVPIWLHIQTQSQTQTQMLSVNVPLTFNRYSNSSTTILVVFIFFFLLQADFVFVAISPQYKRDADRSTEFENGEQITYHGLHTRYIYRLMQNEYTNSMCKNYRFVPLIFTASGARMEHVPEWLKNTLIYR